MGETLLDRMRRVLRTGHYRPIGGEVGFSPPGFDGQVRSSIAAYSIGNGQTLKIKAACLELWQN